MRGLLPADLRQVAADLPFIIHAADAETFAAIRASEKVAFVGKRNLVTFIFSVNDQVGRK